MLAKLIPLLFLALGVGAGVSTALLMASPPEHAVDTTTQDESHGPADAHDTHGAGNGDTEYVKLNNQFVVPVVQDDRIAALVVVSLSLETKIGLRETVFAREPKLRDMFLQVLFDHANMGGFHGNFTSSEMLELLRSALREVAQNELGEEVLNVLIVGIARQDT